MPKSAVRFIDCIEFRVIVEILRWKQNFGCSYHSNYLLFLDCIAPYNVEIDFDAVSDEDANVVNTASSCGKVMPN